MTKLKIATVTVIAVAVSIPIVLQQHTNHRLRREISLLLEQNLPAATARLESQGLPMPQTITTNPPARVFDWQTLESADFRLEGTSIKGVRVRIKTEGSKVVTVHTGPRSYLERQNIPFHHGDQVMVTGSPAKAGRRNVIVASQIKMGDKTWSGVAPQTGLSEVRFFCIQTAAAPKP